MKLQIIVPVSLDEPESVVERSLESLSRLEHGELEIGITYVVDTANREDDARVKFLEKEPVNLIIRDNNRGRRAGAINDALDRIGKVDYIALFDVDSRPASNFLVDAVKRLVGDTVIASGPRYTTNADASVVTKMVSVEYDLLEHLYRLFEWQADSFIQFNGLIGVIDAKVLEKLRFNEEVCCEDVDMTQRIYLEGMTAGVVKSAIVGEQAPITLRDYYLQRLRWMTGACEGLEAYRGEFRHAHIPRKRKISWFLALTTPFICIIFTPLIPLYALYSSTGIKFVLANTGAIFASTCLTMVCSWHAILNQTLKRGVEWKKIERSDI